MVEVSNVTMLSTVFITALNTYYKYINGLGSIILEQFPKLMSQQ